MGMISLKGLEKPAVLAALYNASKPQGMGFLHYTPEPMTFDEAKAILDQGVTYFDYLKGRVMKVDLSGDEFDPWLFDRDNGEGAAQTAIQSLQETGNTNNPLIEKMHADSTFVSAMSMQSRIDDETRIEEDGSMTTITLGTPKECRNELRENINRAKDTSSSK